MNNEEILAHIASQTEINHATERRLGKLEKMQDSMNKLAQSVGELAKSVEAMAREQARQGKQIDVLESQKNETFKFWLRTILTAVTTGLIGYALAYIINQ